MTSPDAASDAGPNLLIQDAPRGGVPYFRWQPPMVAAASVGGTSDGTQKPVVEICSLVGGTCSGPLLATYTSTGGTPRVQYQSKPEFYVVDWNTASFKFKPRKDVRITVKVAGLVLGVADAAVVSKKTDLQALDPTQIVGVVNGATLEIKFRIERNAEGAILAATSNSPTAQTLGTATSSTGTSAQLTLPANTTINGGTGTVALTVQATAPPAGAPTAGLIGTAYEFGPTGTTFSPAVTIGIQYPTTVAAGVAATLRLYALTAAGQWHLTENSSVNQTTRTVTGQSTHFSLYVAAEQVQTVDIVQANATVTVEETVELDATIDQAGREVTWTTSDAAFATVDQTGIVTGVSAGEATITATSEGQSDQATVTVTALGSWVAVDLGTLGGSYSDGYAINDNGQVAGSSYLAGDAVLHAFLWQNGAMTDLGTPGVSNSAARGINDNGQVVGHYQTGTFGDTTHAFLWTPLTPNGTTGTMIDLGTLGGANSSAWDINNQGQVVGVTETADGGPPHAFLWQQGGPMIDLGTLGGSYSIAHAVNDNGQVVGISDLSSGLNRGFLWTPLAPNGTTGTMTDVGTLFGGTQSRAYGINSAGQVVGESNQHPREGGPFFYAFRWQNGTMIDPMLPSEGGGSAQGISDQDQIVGYAGGGGAFLWHNGTRTALGTLGGSASNDKAYGINGNGQIVGSSSVTGDGAYHAALWSFQVP